MKTLGNILWVIFGGLLWSIIDFLIGLILCITILFIPIGLQYFKFSKFVIWPFGKVVVPAKPSGFKTFVNILWAILGGWETALGFFLTGAILCITIIGIPFGKQYFKMAHVAFLPLGHDFAKAE